MSQIRTQLRFIQPKQVNPDYPLFIYLPGMDGTGELFFRQAKNLTRCFDLRYLSIPRDDLSDWDSLATGVIGLIKEELENRQERSIYLCGESFGGCLALKVAIDAPSLLRRLILVNAASSYNQRPLLGWGVRIIEWLPEFLHHNSAVGLLPFLASLERIVASDRAALLKAMKSVPKEIVVWRLSLLKDFAADKQDLKRLDFPTLILAGTSDRLLPSVEEAERLVSVIPKSKMVILPDSGHACLLETKVNLYKILKDYNFLEASVCNSPN